MNDDRFPDLTGFTKTVTVDEWGFVHCRYDEGVLTPVPNGYDSYRKVTGENGNKVAVPVTDPDAVQAGAALRAASEVIRDMNGGVPLVYPNTLPTEPPIVGWVNSDGNPVFTDARYAPSSPVTSRCIGVDLGAGKSRGVTRAKRCLHCHRFVPLPDDACSCGCSTFNNEWLDPPSPTPPKSDAGAVGNDDEPHIVKGN